jgi:hypothetical protein
MLEEKKNDIVIVRLNSDVRKEAEKHAKPRGLSQYVRDAIKEKIQRDKRHKKRVVLVTPIRG